VSFGVFLLRDCARLPPTPSHYRPSPSLGWPALMGQVPFWQPFQFCISAVCLFKCCCYVENKLSLSPYTPTHSRPPLPPLPILNPSLTPVAPITARTTRSGERYSSSPSGSGQSPAAKRIFVQFTAQHLQICWGCCSKTF